MTRNQNEKHTEAFARDRVAGCRKCNSPALETGDLRPELDPLSQPPPIHRAVPRELKHNRDVRSPGSWLTRSAAVDPSLHIYVHIDYVYIEMSS